MALSEAEKILALDLDEFDPNFAKIVARKQAVIASILSASVRVTSSRLRGKEEDKMGDIIAAIREHQAHLKTLN